MSEEIRQATHDAKKPSVLGPVMGLFMALAVGVAAFFSAPFIMEQMQANFTRFDEALIEESEATETESSNEQTIRLAITAFVWFVSFSILILLVSGVAGRDSVVVAERKTLHPRQDELSPRKAEKYYRKISKQRQQKIAALKKLKAKEEAKRRRGGK